MSIRENKNPDPEIAALGPVCTAFGSEYGPAENENSEVSTLGWWSDWENTRKRKMREREREKTSKQRKRGATSKTHQRKEMGQSRAGIPTKQRRRFSSVQSRPVEPDQSISDETTTWKQALLQRASYHHRGQSPQETRKCRSCCAGRQTPKQNQENQWNWR